jgi:hypothetical protein
MPSRKPEPVPFWDKFLWYASIIGGCLVLLSGVPMLPWRYAKTDTNVGNRFVMDRYYTLFGATNQFGKSVGWFSLKNKMKHKNQEFGKPSPVQALVGTVGSELGMGGAAMGCATWQACKDHVGARYGAYYNMAIGGCMAFAGLLIGSVCSFGTILSMSFEDEGNGKKKAKKQKKKHNPDHCCEISAKGRTMVLGICSFAISFIATVGFTLLLNSTLQDFKNTAYYPYAKSSIAAYIAGLGCIVLLMCAVLTVNRHTPFFQKKTDEQEASSTGPGDYGQYTPGTPYGNSGAAPVGYQGPVQW